MGVGLLRGRGGSWFLGLLVFGFVVHSCLVSLFVSVMVLAFGFLASKSLGFKVSKIYRVSISCLLEEIDPISKFFKKSQYGYPACVGARLFQSFQIVGFSNVLNL